MWEPEEFNFKPKLLELFSMELPDVLHAFLKDITVS